MLTFKYYALQKGLRRSDTVKDTRRGQRPRLTTTNLQQLGMEAKNNVYTNGNSGDAAALFWQWFAREEYRFRELKANDSDQALAFLDELIKQMRPFNSWLKALAGPYGDNRYELIITADGEVALFSKVEELVAKAPPLEHWQITAHKPALGFEGISIDMYEKRFSTDTTCFYPIVREHYPDEVSIVLTHVDYNEVDDDQFQAGGMIYLENGLGEVNTATKIDHYETGPLPPPDSGIEVIPISKLADYLNWREKEFVEKYELVNAERPEEMFNALEAADASGKLMLAVIDVSFKDWPLRPAYPWLFQVDILYKGNDRGLPNVSQLDELQETEEAIIQLLQGNNTALYIGHRTYDHVRSIYFYSSEYSTNSRLLHRFIESVQFNFQLTFFVQKDKYWHTMEAYYNATED